MSSRTTGTQSLILQDSFSFKSQYRGSLEQAEFVGPKIFSIWRYLVLNLTILAVEQNLGQYETAAERSLDQPEADFITDWVVTEAAAIQLATTGYGGALQVDLREEVGSNIT